MTDISERLGDSTALDEDYQTGAECILQMFGETEDLKDYSLEG
jgi:hypothetical protein